MLLLYHDQCFCCMSLKCVNEDFRNTHKYPTTIFFHLFVYLGEQMHRMVCAKVSRWFLNSWESVFIWVQIFSLGGNCLYPLRHLVHPYLCSFCFMYRQIFVIFVSCWQHKMHLESLMLSFKVKYPTHSKSGVSYKSW